MKRFLPLLLLALLAACHSPSKRLRIMYQESLRERLDGDEFSTLGDKYARHQRERIESVRELVKNEELTTAEDYLYAGVILSTSSVEDDLIAASASGLKCAELGDTRGFKVTAESVDRLLMHRGKPQRYGTQYYYIEVIKKWRLYDVDPSTTDAERKSMGLPTLAEMKAREDKLNEELR